MRFDRLAVDDLGNAEGLRPSTPNSRPKPDGLAPPNGMRGSTTPCLLTQTEPVWIRAERRQVGGPDGGTEYDVEGVGHVYGFVHAAVFDDG